MLPTIYIHAVIRQALRSQADSLQQVSIVSAGTQVRRRRERACLTTQVAPPGSEPAAHARYHRDMHVPTANLTTALGCAGTSHCRLAPTNNTMLMLIKKKPNPKTTTQ